MSAEQREEAIFEAALKLPAGERAAFLDNSCEGDADLRRRVDVLLSAFERAGGFMQEPATPERTLRFSIPPTEIPGDRIGRYKLLEQIGEGGCGIVYVAEQEEPVRRRVALKIIKLGMDTKQVIARFEAERQALAMMDHPNIAKIFDAGVTDGRARHSVRADVEEPESGRQRTDAPYLSPGRPFFVMELVRGIKITDFCAQHQLEPRERLDLFIHVCRAIQHAHQKGIIHRDIKPSNILVTSDDGVPVPKVIDFGIAKATHGRLTDQTIYTAFEQFIGTPAYMSPEQAQLTMQDIDTRSDIYSLGVLLYELLTGTTPFDAKELLSKGLDEMRRTIREKEPPRPSTRLSSMAIEELTTTAHRRQTDVPRLIHLVKGDLDWIVMKCLEKERARRYETANGLAADVDRYLKNEPIVARPPSQWYSLQKFARRNRGALTVAAFAVLALLLGVVGLVISNVRILREQTQKETALKAAQKSDQESRQQLFASLKSQAEARRYGHRIGQRLESLAALKRASQIHRDDELRDAAIAALAMPDLRTSASWDAWQPEDANNQGITFDANYARYAWVDSQGVIRIHTVADRQEVQRFASGPAAQRRGRSFMFSPDGRFLAKFEVEDRWSIWRVDDGQLVIRTQPTSGAGFAFSHDSTQVALPMETSIVIVNLETGRERKRWPIRQLPHVMEFSPNSQQLAAGSLQAAEIAIYDVAKGELLSQLPAGKSGERVLAWYPSGKYLAVCANQRIQFWDVQTATLVSTLEGHAQAVTSLSFDPTGTWLLSDSWDGTPRLWQPSPAREWMRFFSGLNQLRFSKNGRFAGVIFPEAGAGNAQLLEFIPSEVYHTFVGSLLDREHSFSWADISPDGRMLALVSREVSIRELPSGRELTSLPTPPRLKYPRWLKFHPNGKELIVSGYEPGLEIWSLGRDAAAPGTIRLGPPRHVALPFVPCEIALARDGRTIGASAPDSAEARIADLYTGTVRDVKFPHTNTDSVTLSSDARWLAAAGWHSTQAQLWNVQTGERLLEVPAARARVTFTPDDRQLVVSTSQAYVFYDIETQKITRRFERQGSMHCGWLAYSPDGKLMALEVSPGVIRLCEVQTGRTIAHLQDPNGNVSTRMCFTPDGTQLIVAATYERAIHRWDLRAMRVELKAMGLDWDWPEFPPESAEAKNPPAFQVEVLGGE